MKPYSVAHPAVVFGVFISLLIVSNTDLAHAANRAFVTTTKTQHHPYNNHKFTCQSKVKEQLQHNDDTHRLIVLLRGGSYRGDDDDRYYNNYYEQDDEDDGYYYDRPNSFSKPSNSASALPSSLPDIIKKGDKNIGILLLGSGTVITMFGISLFFNKALMRLGNLLFIVGVPMTIGPTRTMKYFFQSNKMRSTICLGIGIFLVFLGYPVVGILCEIFGLLNLFGNMFPFVLAIVKQMPFVKSIVNTSSSSSDRRRPQPQPQAPSSWKDDYNDDDRYYYEDENGGNDQDYYYNDNRGRTNNDNGFY